MRRYLLALPLAIALASASAQVGLPSHDGTPSVSTGSLPLTYTGGDTRASVGVDEHGNTQGELAQVFGDNGEHAVVAQLWWGHGGAGGIQADYNWLFGTTLDEAKRDPDSVTVAKLSFAIDQNAEKQRQANVGLAIERKEFFLNFFLSGKASGTRESGAASETHSETTTATDDVGTYTQTRTDIATTLLLSQPYTYTVGVHGGHFSDAITTRFNGGFDYAHGDQGASQRRVSLSVDKYIGTHGWSISGIAEHAQNTSPVGKDTSDDRFWMFVRYEFGGGGAFRPYDDSASQNAAWLARALHEPVVGHPRNVDTYVTRGKTVTTSTFTPKQYTARFPVARADAATVEANASGVDIDVLANDTDPDNGTLTISAVGTPAHGTATIAGTRIRYVPAPSYVGTDEFTYTVTGSKGLTATAKVSVTVNPGPPPGGSSPPVARDDTTTTPFGKPVAVAVLGNDSDPSGYPLTVTSATQPAHGSAHVNADGTITYTPNAAYTGPDRFAYTIDNGHGGTASATVTVVVQPAPPPVAVDDAATTPYDTPVDVNVLANDSDAANYPLSVVSITQPANGSAKILASGQVRYTPGVEFSGSDQFTYTISDGHGGVAGAKVVITVLEPSATLIAGNDSATAQSGAPVTIDVLANDYPPPGKTLSLKAVTTPLHGTATIVSNAIRYTPAAGYVGSDSFTYTVGDGSETTTANVTVTVTPANPPIAQNDSAKTSFRQAVVIDVLANDSDPNTYPLTVSAITAAPAHGAAVINGDNTVTYTPASTFAGDDAFTYRISDGHGGTATAQVTVTVQPPPPPVANNDVAVADFQKPVVIHVLANDTDANGLPLTVTAIAQQPGFGTVAINGDNTITYTPNAGYSGEDVFEYTISNGFGTSTASVAMSVNEPLPPVAVDDAASTPFQTPVTVNVLQNDSDPNGLPLSIVTYSQPTAYGVVTQEGNALKFTPNAEATGDVTFSYTITDGFNTASANVKVTVDPPAQPKATPFSYSGPPPCYRDGNSCDICLDDHIQNPAGLYVTVGTTGTTTLGGTTSVNSANGCQYNVTYMSPDPSDPGNPIDTFTYTVYDVSYSRQSSATVSVTIDFASGKAHP